MSRLTLTLDMTGGKENAPINPSTLPGAAAKSRDMKLRLLVVISTAVSLTSFAQQNPQKLADAELPSLLTIYKDLHSHPELSTQEQRTAALLAKELKAVGCDVTENVGKYENADQKCYGVVGLMKNGDGPVVLVRTDLDALPVQEETGLPYASKLTAKNEKGDEVHVMHACGHDAHVSMLIGVARSLAKLKDQWRGTIVFIGQPAEELGTGARAMLRQALHPLAETELRARVSRQSRPGNRPHRRYRGLHVRQCRFG